MWNKTNILHRISKSKSIQHRQDTVRVIISAWQQEQNVHFNPSCIY